MIRKLKTTLNNGLVLFKVVIECKLTRSQGEFAINYCQLFLLFSESGSFSQKSKLIEVV